MDEMLKPLPIVLQNERESLAISVEIGCCMHEPANELGWFVYLSSTAICSPIRFECCVRWPFPRACSPLRRFSRYLRTWAMLLTTFDGFVVHNRDWKQLISITVLMMCEKSPCFHGVQCSMPANATRTAHASACVCARILVALNTLSITWYTDFNQCCHMEQYQFSAMASSGQPAGRWFFAGMLFRMRQRVWDCEWVFALRLYRSVRLWCQHIIIASSGRCGWLWTLKKWKIEASREWERIVCERWHAR